MVEQTSRQMSDAEANRATAKILVSWRLTALFMADALKRRGFKRDGKRLSQAVDQLNLLWALDFGDIYGEELTTAINAYNKWECGCGDRGAQQ